MKRHLSELDLRSTLGNTNCRNAIRINHSTFEEVLAF
jgi:hypothetical protein